MKYIKKVSVAQLQSNTGTIIDSMNSGDDAHVNAPSINAVKDYVENYSTSETRIGTWIDGKPLYRKVILYTPTVTIGATNTMTMIEIPHNISNLKYVIKTTSNMFDTNGNTTQVPNISGNTNVTTGVVVNAITPNAIRLRIVNDTWGATRTWCFILEYTKTTD